MNKIVCNVCGTSYPENAAQCPICGFSRSTDIDSSISGEERMYTHVKGGRFSKANVKKRNKVSQKASEKAVVVEPDSKKAPKEKTSAGMVIIVIVLLLAIIAVVGYIALRFFLPNDFIFEGLDNLTLPASTEEIQEDPDDIVDPATEPEEESTVPTDSLVCTGISFDESDIELDAIGSTYQLSVYLEPVNTVDPVVYTSSDESIVMVDGLGTITAVGEGTAIISASCGDFTAECSVTCTISTTEPETETLVLNRKEITFDVEEQTWLLYDGNIPADEITWSSDDNNVATIEDGEVVAVGNGDTTVYGIYNGQTVSCIIHCNFDSEDSGSAGNVSEAVGDVKRTYKLYNPNGYADDVTIKVDEEFTLMLVDENKKEVTDATWKISDEKICSYKKNTVKGLKSGTAEVTATYEGSTYTCVVRVN